MAHDTYHMLINHSLDGEIAQADQAKLEQHIENCLDCADLFQRMQIVDVMLARPVEVPAPVDFTAKVMARIQTYEARREWTPWFIGFFAGASLLAAISVALPIILLSLGIDGITAISPALGHALLDVFSLILIGVDGILLVVNLVSNWITYIFNEPFALGTVLAALMLASTWIGVLESSKLSSRTSQTVTT